VVPKHDASNDGAHPFGGGFFVSFPGYGERMTGVVWTRQQQTNTLRAIPVVRANVSSDDPQQNITAATRAVADLVPGGANATNAQFAEVAPDIITGLVNVAATLAEHLAEATGTSVQQVLDNVTEAWRSVPLSD
jgi:hypothetical protein